MRSWFDDEVLSLRPVSDGVNGWAVALREDHAAIPPGLLPSP